MKGDGKTRILGFGLPTPTYELEQQLPGRIRSAFAAARVHDMALMLHFDFHLAWKHRPDLWNWFDPAKPGFDPNNKYNVEWHGWDGPPNKVHYLNHGVLERLPPNMCYTSKRTRAEVTRIVSKVIGPILREEIATLKAEGKEALFAGVLVGSEPSIDDYSKPNPELAKMMKEDDVSRGTARLSGAPGSWLQGGQTTGRFPIGPREDRSGDDRVLVRAIRRRGYPRGKALSPRSRPRAHRGDERSHLDGFQQVFPTRLDHLCGRGTRGRTSRQSMTNWRPTGIPPWAGVEANAGIPGSLVDWETYLAWHYNHGCLLVGVNMGATGEDLPRRLRDSAFSKEAIAAYHKFLTGQPLVEKPFVRQQPQFRIQAKMKRVLAGIQRWQRSGKDPSAVGKLMERAQPLANAGRLVELEKLVDQALEMLGDNEQVPDAYRKE